VKANEASKTPRFPNRCMNCVLSLLRNELHNPRVADLRPDCRAHNRHEVYTRKPRAGTLRRSYFTCHKAGDHRFFSRRESSGLARQRNSLTSGLTGIQNCAVQPVVKRSPVFSTTLCLAPHPLSGSTLISNGLFTCAGLGSFGLLRFVRVRSGSVDARSRGRLLILKDLPIWPKPILGFVWVRFDVGFLIDL